MQDAIKSVARIARSKGVAGFLLGIIKQVEGAGKKGYEIIVHRENLTVKQALMIALQMVHTVMDWELQNVEITRDEARVIQGFKEDLNKLVRATDKALMAAQAKRK